MKPKAIAILSGGLDSAVNTAWALREYEVTEALTFDYGQKAAPREIRQSALLADYYHIPHRVIPLPFLASWTATALVNREEKFPGMTLAGLDNAAAAKRSAAAVWVPNRNGVFINVAASLAESSAVPCLIVGFNKEEGATFPDNSRDFLDQINRSLFYSTMNHVEVICKTAAMNKNEIIQKGLRLNFPFHLIWSCYGGGEQMCGECESCLRLKRAASEHPGLLEALAFAS